MEDASQDVRDLNPSRQPRLENRFSYRGMRSIRRACSINARNGKTFCPRTGETEEGAGASIRFERWFFFRAMLLSQHFLLLSRFCPFFSRHSKSGERRQRGSRGKARGRCIFSIVCCCLVPQADTKDNKAKDEKREKKKEIESGRKRFPESYFEKKIALKRSRRVLFISRE